jgi:xanthine dehydrogenase accessory factor
VSRKIKEIYRALQQGRDVVVASVIKSSGSTPRTSGSKMVVHKDGSIFGTIGGGEVEGDVIRLSLNVFETADGQIASYDLNRSGAKDSMDLICGGSMEVLLEYVSVSSENSRLYEDACSRIDEGQPFIWAATVVDKDDHVTIDRYILEASKDWEFKNNRADAYRDGYTLRVSEPIIPVQTVYIFGAGHVSLELARLTGQLELNTHVFDDREEFANRERFPQADGVHVCPGFLDVFKPFMIGQESYIVIVTRGHSFDKKVLAQALQTDAGYIGMIGSRKKRNTIYDELVQEGFERSMLENVHCPIGLPILAETAAEIGISIVAELIQHRGQHNSQGLK